MMNCHCTARSCPRFWSPLTPEELADKVRGLFDRTPPVVLTAYERTLIGPKQVATSLIGLTSELDNLNMQLYELLNKLGVTYDNPEWVGKGHIFHVTERVYGRLEVGNEHTSKAIYLIEVKVPGYGHKRIVREGFELG